MRKTGHVGLDEPWTRHDGSPPYYTATFRGHAGPLRVAAARPTKMAGVAATDVAVSLIQALDPRCLAMCGVCAGHPEDTDLGDVIIAERGAQRSSLIILLADAPTARPSVPTPEDLAEYHERLD